ncbi:MAG: ATP-binding cassette domain-containing protein [Mucilaginibacter sp.]
MKSVITKILIILNPKEKLTLCKLIALELLICFLDIVFLGMLVLIINFYTRNSSVQNGLLLHLLSNKNAVLVVCLFFLLFSLKNFSGYLIAKSENFFFYNVATRLSGRNAINYLKSDHTQFIEVDSSVFIRRISQQPIEFSNYILTNLQQVISQSILIMFTLVAIVLYHPVLFLLLFALLLPPVVLLAYFIRKRLRTVRENTKISGQRAIQHLQETLAGYIESNLYHKNNFFTNRYNNYQQQLNQNIATQQTLQGLPARLIEVFAILGFFILIAVNKWAGGVAGVDLLNVGVFMVASYKIIPGVVKILNCTGQIKTYQFVLDDLQSAEDNIETSTPTEPVLHIKQIRFDGVGFNFGQQQLFKDLSFEIVSGDFVGMFGKSGAGKTTLINILLGFIKPDIGSISINDQSLDSLERRKYWPRISYIKQQTFFINDSVLKNITLSDSDYDAVKLAEIVTFCGLDDMLAQYPEGVNKIITENGKNISGGQRQRMMLARALYHDFDLLIIDEPFSELDERAEHQLLTKLKQLTAKGKMILFITHNQASLAFCTQTILLHDEK